METKRLIIDAFKESDRLDYFINIAHDRLVLQTFICPYEETIDNFDFSKYINSKRMFAVRLKETGEAVGIILHFNETSDACEVGYAIGSKHWNKGYTTEAMIAFIEYCFDTLKVKKVYASFFKENIASKRVMEKAGMHYSHTIDNELTYLDKPRDLCYYVIEKK